MSQPKGLGISERWGRSYFLEHIVGTVVRTIVPCAGVEVDEGVGGKWVGHRPKSHNSGRHCEGNDEEPTVVPTDT